MAVRNPQLQHLPCTKSTPEGQVLLQQLSLPSGPEPTCFLLGLSPRALIELKPFLF